MDDGSAAVRVSVGTLELIQGGSWEGTGLTPDREVALTGDNAFELREEKEDNQLQTALTLFSSTPDMSESAATTGTGTSGTGTTGTGTGTSGTGAATSAQTTGQTTAKR